MQATNREVLADIGTAFSTLIKAQRAGMDTTPLEPLSAALLRLAGVFLTRTGTPPGEWVDNLVNAKEPHADDP